MTIGLRVVQGDQVGPARDFDRDVVRVGRDPANDVVLTDAAGVSRHHAELRYAGGEWRVVDLQSSNGTYVGGRRVTEARLRDGDEVQFAPQGPRLRVSLPTMLGDTTAGARTPAQASAPATSIGGPAPTRPDAARPDAAGRRARANVHPARKVRTPRRTQRASVRRARSPRSGPRPRTENTPRGRNLPG
jgi:hypothetical protein